MSAAKIRKLEQSLVSGRFALLLLLINVAAYTLGHVWLGGSSLLAEPREGESYLRPLNGEEIRVSSAVGWYSTLHGLSVVLTIPSVAIFSLMYAGEWLQLKRLRRTVKLQRPNGHLDVHA